MKVPKRMNPACCVSRKSLPFYYLIADMKGREDSRGDIPSYLYSLPLGLSELKGTARYDRWSHSSLPSIISSPIILKFSLIVDKEDFPLLLSKQRKLLNVEKDKQIRIKKTQINSIQKKRILDEKGSGGPTVKTRRWVTV